MHMANELLSPSFAVVSCAVAAGGLGYVCRRAKAVITSDNFAFMGILGAFVFAAQMVKFPLPLMPGVSGHMIGAVLLAIVLGPFAGALAISSVVIVQCLVFQDGGLLALGCNIINMALVPSFLGYYVYRGIVNSRPSRLRMYWAAMIACTVALVAGAGLVVVEVSLSGVLLVPFATFLTAMVSVHVVIGVIEGLITAGVLVYLTQTRPNIIADCHIATVPVSSPRFYAVVICVTVLCAGVFSVYASDLPDGLEWSYAERPDQPGFGSIAANENPTVKKVDNLQDRYSLLPDYTVRSRRHGTVATGSGPERAGGWTSFAGVVGSAVSMMVIWGLAAVLKRRGGDTNASPADR